MSKIYWLLIGDERIGSSRIHAINIHKLLVSAGFSSHVLIAPKNYSSDIPNLLYFQKELDRYLHNNDLVIFQKVDGKNATSFLQYLTARGIKTIFIDCDLPLKPHMALHAHLTICPSRYLTEMYLSIGVPHVKVIEDFPENFRAPIKPKATQKDTLTCVWFGQLSNPNKLSDINKLKNLLSSDKLSNNWKLITISDTSEADYQWDLTTFFGLLPTFDVAAIPISNITEEQKAKSSNRLLQAMASGVPVVASPIPAYQEIVVNHLTGFICNDDTEWVNALNALSDPQERYSIAANAYNYVAKHYNHQQLLETWAETIKSVNPHLTATSESDSHNKIKYIISLSSLVHKPGVTSLLFTLRCLLMNFSLSSIKLLLKTIFAILGRLIQRLQ